MSSLYPSMSLFTVETMSRIPMGGYNNMPNPALYESFPQAYIGMGDTAENLAFKYQIDRKTQEAFALESQLKAYTAQQQGRFDDEIIPITSKYGTVNKDGCLRPDSTPLSKPPVRSPLAHLLP